MDIAKIFLWMQMVFAILILIGAVAMFIRSMIAVSDAFIVLCFAAMVATAWHMMVKPSIAEIKAEKGGEK